MNFEFYDFPKITINGKIYWEVLSKKDLKEKKGVKVQLGDDYDLQVAIFLVDEQLYCVSNVCPHKHQDKIYEGFIKDTQIMCPLHGWTYNLKTGENVNNRQGVKRLNTYQVIELDGKIYIEEPEISLPKWRTT
jgi:nitrite reductase/ring-hydroxylating ferredoxin subunit